MRVERKLLCPLKVFMQSCFVQKEYEEENLILAQIT